MKEVVNTIVQKLSQELGDQLEAVFLFGSLAQNLYQTGESDINLLAVVADDTSIHTLREQFLPIWQEYGDVLRRAPLIAPKSTFVRFLTVAPSFSHNLHNHGEILFGPPNYLDEWPKTGPDKPLSRLAWEAMHVSPALTPKLLNPEKADELFVKLRRLARRLHGKPLEKDLTAVELFSLVQHYFGQQLSALTGQLVDPEPTSTTSMMLPGLIATYTQSSQLVMVFQRLSPHQILAIQWPDLAKRVTDRCKGLIVTTTDQLRLAVELERPLDLVFQRYEHEWGEDPLAQITPSTRQALRQAARLPAEVQIDIMPNAYLTQDSSKIHDIIHDIQNKLLNIQLEHELLYRLQQIERFTPPEPLPDRSAPSSERIEAIYKQLGWWSEYYAREMQKYEE